MIWSWSWHWAARHVFLELHPTVAARLDAAVQRFAATGDGHITRLVPTDHQRLVLTVEGAGAVLFLDEHDRVVKVTRVWRRR